MRTIAWSLLFVAVAARADVLVVANRGGNSVTIIDPVAMKALATVDAGPEPHEVAISADGHRAYVSNYAHATGNSLTLIDLDAKKNLKQIPLNLDAPHGLLEFDGKIFFTAERSGVVGRLDPATEKVEWVGRPDAKVTHMIALSKDASVVYTANIVSGSVSIICIGGNESTARAQIPTVSFAEGIALSPDGREVWSGSARDGGVAVVDVKSEKVVARMSEGESAYRLVFTPDGKHVLAPRGKSVVVYDAATRALERSIDFEGQPLSIAMAPGTKYAYVSTAGPDRVEKLDLTTWKSVANVAAGPIPDGLAWRATKT